MHRATRKQCLITWIEAMPLARQKGCNNLFTSKTKVKWQHRDMTVLRIVLETGFEMTKAMFEALEMRPDPSRNERHLYQDKDGIQYSLDQYLWRFMGDLAKKKRLGLVQYL
jgi:hypothetical protein